MSATSVHIPADFGGDEDIELVTWVLDDGAVVATGDVVAEVATAKAEVEIQSPAAGVLRHAVEVGALLEAGNSIGSVEHE